MKRIVNDKIVNPFTEQSIMVSFEKKDADGKRVPLKDKSGELVKDQIGGQVYEMEEAPLTTAGAIRIFLSTAFPAQAREGATLKPATLIDSDHALQVLAALRPFKLLDQAMIERQPKHVALDEDIYKWLSDAMRERAPSIWGVLAKLYTNAVERLEMVEEPPAVQAGSSNGSSRKAAAATK